jgi:hypothetical protein
MLAAGLFTHRNPTPEKKGLITANPKPVIEERTKPSLHLATDARKQNGRQTHRTTEANAVKND